MPWIGRPLMKLKNSQETEPPGDYNKLINVVRVKCNRVSADKTYILLEIWLDQVSYA